MFDGCCLLQAVTAGRRLGQARHVGKPQLQPDPGVDLSYAAEQVPCLYPLMLVTQIVVLTVHT